MNTAKRSKLLAAQQALSPDLQTIIKTLAVYNSYISPAKLSKCLAHLGLKGDKDELGPKLLKAYLKPLLDTDLIEESRQSGAVQSGAVRCNRAIAEIIVREMVASGEFERYAVAIEQENPATKGFYGYHLPEEYLRTARIAFYRGDIKKLNTSFDNGSSFIHNFPYSGDILLSWFLNPLDIEWTRRYQAQIFPQLLELSALHQILYLYAAPELDALLTQLTPQSKGLDQGLLVQWAMELRLLRGEWEEVRRQLANNEDPELQAIFAAATFLEGEHDQALILFNQALTIYRKATRQRTGYFHGLAGIFYPLALWKSNDEKQRAKSFTILGQAIRCRTYWAEVYTMLAQFFQFLQGNLAIRTELLATDLPSDIGDGLAPDGTPLPLFAHPLLSQVFCILIKYWTKADQYRSVPAENLRLYNHLKTNGYAWPAAELAKIFAGIEPKKAALWDSKFLTTGKPGLAGLFVTQPYWQLALDSLSNLAKKGKKSDAPEKPIRLTWLLHFDEKHQHLTIEPREQKQQVNGGWSKGRAVALKRLAQEHASIDYLSDHDRKICSKIKPYQDSGWYHNTITYAFAEDMPVALIGHPFLFWANAPEVRVEVLRGEAELRVKKQDKGDKISITLVPLPEPEKKIHITKEAPTRLKVVEFTDEHHQLTTILGKKGLEVPLFAQDRVLQTLTDISGILTVHSDIGGSSSTAEQVAADTTPRLHLLPMGGGLRASLLVRPFATVGAYYQPGHGGESVLAEIDGKALQAQRQLPLEKQRAAAILAACPMLQNAERERTGDWLLEDPEECLEMLLQIQTLPAGEVILEWPEGVRFRLLGQTSGKGFTMRINRDTDWFALHGELQVDEETVVEIGQLLKLLGASHGRFLQLQDGQFFALTDEFRRRLEELRSYADISGKKVRINPLAALTLEDWQAKDGFKGDKHWREHLQRMRDARSYQPQLPSTFQAELREYQAEGYSWLARLARWKVGACLADDMGLGKTIQGLALLVERAPNGPALVIAPTSVCMNWEREADRFAPTLRPLLLGNNDRQQVLDSLAPFDLLICSYGLLQQEQVAAMLAQVSFTTIILDEAQAIKNTGTRRSQGAMNLQADFKLIMTGTPLENHLGELWNLFRFINPGLLGSLEHFNQRFALPIERDQNPQTRRALKKLIQPFILRRTKTQVLQELPPRTEIPMYVELSPEETAFYEALRRQSLAEISDTEGQPGQKHLQILAAITKLRRSCCNTRLVNSEIALPSSKLEVFGTIVDDLLENKHKALVFSQFVGHLQCIREYLDSRAVPYQYLDGGTPAKERQLRVDAFQGGEGELFLISLKAGGLGLNLTAADYVIHMDPWWNPAVEDQASDRAHRIGQQRPVTIYRLIAKNTIEEKIVALHSQKRDLADSLLEGAELSGKMSADDLLALMQADTPLSGRNHA